MLIGSACVICGIGGETVCAACHATLRPAPALPPPMLVDRCSALLDYRSTGPLIPALKNRNRRDLVAWLAAGMAELVDPPQGAVVTWAPTLAARRRSRGFDQAQLLAAAVARRIDASCVPLLRRDPGPAQVGRSAAERAVHPGFTCREAPASSVVLVDDVVTTGATLAAAARALRAAGVAQVHAVVAARAPVRIGPHLSGTQAGSVLR